MSKKSSINLKERYRVNQDMDALGISPAHETLKKIKELDLAANPIHFTLIYEALNNIDSQFSPKIQDELANETYHQSYEALYIDHISQLLYEYLPTEKVHNLIRDLLKELEKWIMNSKKNEVLISSEIAEFSKLAMPSEIQDRLKDSLLRPIHSMLDETSKLQSHISNSANEITQLKNELEKVKQVANTDELTGIPNRRGFNEFAKKLAEEAQKSDELFALIMLDVDFFKTINDEYGHLVGDSVLRYLARQLDSETKGKDFIARIGGEEFIVLLPQTGYDNALKVANALRQKVEDSILKVKNYHNPLKLTISAGVAIYNKGEEIPQLISRADKALYQAKKTGRNKVC